MQAEIRNVLVGIVQHCMEVAAQIHQIVIDGCQLLLQHPSYLPGSVGSGIGSVGFDQVNDSLRLSKVQLAV